MIPDFENTAYTKNNDNKFMNISKNENFTKFNFPSKEVLQKKENQEVDKILMKKYTNHYFCWNYFHMKEFFNLIKNGQYFPIFRKYCLLFSFIMRR